MNKTFLFALLLLANKTLFATDPDTVFNAQFRQDIGGWIAGDGTFSISLPDGRTLWLFGDTFIGTVDANNKIVSGAKFIRNSAVIQEGEILETLFGGSRTAPTDFIPTEYPDSIWYWPEQGMVENDTLRIFVSKFGTDPEGVPGWNFKQLGSCIASYTWPGIEYITKTDLLAEKISGVIYGDRLLADTAYVYIYGRRTDDPEINIAYPHVARAREGEVMKQQWEYFTGSGWSADPLETARMGSTPVSQEYSVSTYKGKYILLTQDIWLSPKIYSYTSDSPTGPWSNRKLIYTTPETGGSTFTYNAYAHPQFDKNNELLLSYNVNGDFSAIFNNVELYRPRFLRVPYMNIDYAFWPDAVGYDNTAEGNSYRIYPNPTMDQFTLSVNMTEPASINIKLYNAGGKLVLSPPETFINGNREDIRISAETLMAGTYFLRINDGRNSCTLPLYIIR